VGLGVNMKWYHNFLAGAKFALQIPLVLLVIMFWVILLFGPIILISGLLDTALPSGITVFLMFVWFCIYCGILNVFEKFIERN
jgi:hypothetical protein